MRYQADVNTKYCNKSNSIKYFLNMSTMVQIKLQFKLVVVLHNAQTHLLLLK